jgi:butyrate kinase
MMEQTVFRILVVNPGSTTTKLALFENEIPLWFERMDYSPEQCSTPSGIPGQFDFRLKDIERILQAKKVDVPRLSAVGVRGGTFKPLEGGTYRIDEAVLADVREGRVEAEHASNLGVLLGAALARPSGLPAFFIDPVSVDEFEPVARVSGIPELERKSLLHALNIKATARILAEKLGKNYYDMDLIAAHLGGGISICAMKKSRIVDVNNAVEGGPFSPERSGSLPVSSLVRLCYSGRFTFEEMKRRLIGRGGMVAHLGIQDAKKVEDRIDSGDKKAEIVYQAMAYQIAKEIGAMAAVLSGRVDAVFLTGGLAHSALLTGWIKNRVSFIAPVFVFPGEREMEALALGVMRVLRGDETARTYS